MARPCEPDPTAPRRVRRAARVGAGAVVVVALAAGVAACGGSSKSASPAPTTTTAAPKTTPSGGGSTPSTTAAPATSTTAAIPASSGGGFCHEAQTSLAKSLKAEQSLGESPTDLRQVVANFDKEAPALLASVPAAIKPQMSTLLGFDKKIFALLAKADYNFTQISPSDLSTIESEASTLTADSEAIDAYVEKACGITLPTSPTT